MKPLRPRRVHELLLAATLAGLAALGGTRARAQETGPAAAGATLPVAWRSGAATLAAATPRDVARVLGSAVGARPAGHVVLQLDGPVHEATRARLARAGVELLEPLGAGAWFAAVRRPALDARRAAGVPGVLAASPVRAEWKQHPDLLTGAVLPWSVVGSVGQRDPLVALYVLFHRDVPLDTTARRRVRGLGGRVVDALESVNGLVVELPRSAVGALAAADVVQWIEPPLPPLADVNDSNRARTQAEVVQQGAYGLDGSGVTVLVYDGGTARATHVDFGGRLAVRDASGLSNHATHVSGTIAGDGSASGGLWRGMAPGARIESYGYEDDGSGIFLYTNPGDFEADYDEAIHVFGADLANNSIGTNTETNGLPCNIQGDYGVMSSVIDAVVRGSLGEPFRVVWANGNERQGSACDLEGFGDYYSTAPPATAKNHITVGAVNSNDDSMTSFSSWGPTDDGRIKPDVSAPGCQSNDDFGVTSTGAAADDAYTISCGTSMAAPTVTGLCALLLQDHRATFGGPDPRNSTLKALLAQCARDRGNPGPDNQFGFGSVRIQDTIDLMRLGRFREESVATTGDGRVYSVQVDPGESELRLTLAWDDAPGVPNVLGALVNDLDLLVFDPLGGRHHPWTLDPTNPGAPARRDRPDRVNNVEQVLVEAPLPGAWRVEVHGHDVPLGPQPFSIAASHDLLDGPFVAISFPVPPPAVLAPGLPTAVDVSIVAVNDVLVPTSPVLGVRYAGGAFLELPLAPLSGDLWRGTLPPAVCGATPEFWFRAEGVSSGPVLGPPDAPSAPLTAEVGTESELFADDFELDLGWTVQSAPSLTDGAWQRGVPAGDGSRNDPTTDWDGSGACLLTDNAPGNSDVDGGPTTVTSPLLDLSSAVDPTISYALWFANDDLDADSLDVEVSDDGGATWTLVESLGNTSGWGLHGFRLLDHAAATGAVQVRFSATDDPNDSVTEAAVDAFLVVDGACSAALADCNGNGIDDADDVASGRSSDCDRDGQPDECEPDADGDGLPDACDPDHLRIGARRPARGR